MCATRLVRHMVLPISSGQAVTFRATVQVGWDRILFRGLQTSPASVPRQLDIPIMAATTTTIGDRENRGIKASVRLSLWLRTLTKRYFMSGVEPVQWDISYPHSADIQICTSHGISVSPDNTFLPTKNSTLLGWLFLYLGGFISEKVHTHTVNVQ